MGMFEILIVLIALLIGTYTDIKVREVPDWLNFSLLGFGFGIALIKSVISVSFLPIIYGFSGFGLGFLISVLMFYTGQWGGGDAKMLMAIGAVFGASLSLSDFFISFVVNIVIVGAIYGLLWGFVLGIINRKKIPKEMIKLLNNKKYKKARNITLILTFILTIFTLLQPINEIKFPLLALSLIFFSTFYLWIYVKVIENISMIKKVKPNVLTEGDWIIEDVVVGQKIIASKKDLGVSKEQIQELIKKKVKSVTIKIGIPFIPSFLISLFLTYFFGNLFLLFLI